MDQPICSDPFWNRSQTWDTDHPQLSSCFGSLVLRLVPCLLLFLLSPIELLVRPKKKTVAWAHVTVLRLLFTLIAFLIHVIDFFDVIYSEKTTALIDPVASFFMMTAYLWSACVLATSKNRGFVRSGVVWMFVVLSCITTTIDFIVEDRINLTSTQDYAVLVHLPVALILLFLCCIGDTPVLKKGERVSERDTASFPSILTFSWADTLAYAGWKRFLNVDDLHALPEVNRTAYLGQILKKHLFKRKEKAAVLQVNVAVALMKAFKWDILHAVVFRIITDLSQLMNPLLLKWLLAYSILPHEPHWHGYVIAFLMCVSAQTSSIAENMHFDSTLTTGVRVRTALMTCIYQKALRISNSVRRERTVGEIVNLMSIDADRFPILFEYIHLSWAGVLQIGAATYLLYREVGVSAFAGLGVLFLAVPFNMFAAAMTQSSQKEMMRQKDKRVNSMSEILNGIKVIKLYAWEEAFMNMISRIRAVEVTHIRRLAYFVCLPGLIFGTTPSLVTLATFATYLLMDSSHFLDPAKVFFCLSIFNVIRHPLTVLPKHLAACVNALVSVQRLNEFFSAPDIVQYVTRQFDEGNCVTMKNAVLSWDGNETSFRKSADDVTSKTALLHWNSGEDVASSNFVLSIDLHLPEGSLLAVVGQVGSGKSSLISAMLGEMQLTSGSVNVSSAVKKIAYVPQQAWILNDTLKGNVLFGKDDNRAKYKRIIQLCELSQDLAILPAGDQTEIGEKGINLSGGQKQRVSIARACYSDADLFLFDDPLSAVDAHVAKKLFENIFSSQTGLLRGRTRVLVTNNLSFLPEVDKILVIANGRIAESGTYEELVKKDGLFAQTMKEFSSHNKSCEEDVKEGKSIFVAKTEFLSGEKIREESLLAVATDEKTKLVTTDVLIEEEKREAGNVRMSVFVNYFRDMPLLWIIFAGFILSQVCDAGSNYWLSLWSRDHSLPLNNGTFTGEESLQISRISVYAALGLSRGAFLTIGVFQLARGSVVAAVKLHNNLLKRVMHSPMSFFETTPIGRILNRFSKDMESIDRVLLVGFMYLLSLSADLAGTIAMVMFALPLYAFALLPMSLIFFSVQRYYVATARQVRRLESTTRSKIYSQFSETLSGVSSIRAYAVGDMFVNQFDHRVDVNESCSISALDLIRWRTIRLDIIGNLTVVITALLSVAAKGRIDPGIVGLAVTYAMKLPMLLDRVVKGLSDVETEAVAIERLLEYTQNEQEADWRCRFCKKPAASWPTEGAISFQNYAARYRQGLELVIKNMNAHINPREKVGIVGRTGAGKSTITLSLFRIIEPAFGKIIIDGVDVSGIGLHDLRSKLTIIPQEPVLFSGTLRTNLDPFEEKTDEELWLTLELSHLKDFVSGLESGLNYQVSEGGENLSVGQRQLICLARALLRKTKILVLDEATAAVDVETDALIQATVRSQFTSCTILTIAHRINTILDSDRILVMDEGRVAEFDSPEQLLRDKESLFYSLARDAGIL